VASYQFESDFGSTNIIASYNYNTQEFDSDPSEFFNNEDQFDFENALPESRGVVTLVQSFDEFEVLFRLNYFGEYENSQRVNAEELRIQSFDPEYQFDLEGRYLLNENITLVLGARNIFDTYPDPGEIGETCCGRIYRSDSIVDWQGGFYYARIMANF
jgi:iron complex outermembrane receptor protein